ncbi:MAG: FAD-dependent oxidoreductase [Elusimicrobia bacterium]|nr:FAD-dependent oxidoreductase [Elusimicrobiota bacterium]
MTTRSYRYVIVGAGLAGVSAAQAIRERDHSGAVLLMGAERQLPYDRPPLSKKLWTGAKTVAQISLHDEGFYAQRDIALALGRRALAIDARHKTLIDSQGQGIGYERLLLAAGGAPRRLPIPGSGLEGVCYFRTLEDYLYLREKAAPGRSAVVIGGGFIGSELAAALTLNKVDVTMVFPSPYLCSRVLPESLGRAVQKTYRDRGVNVLCGDEPVSIESVRRGLRTRTRAGHEIDSDLVVVGVGIAPRTALAREAGLVARDGVLVDRFLETSRPGIYAAGDLAAFPCPALGRRLRMEHWDNARSQGVCAGRNMAGGRESFGYLPYFFSDLFDFGYEAVGDVDASLETRCEWQEKDRKGTVYYLKDGRVRGALMCNVWDRVDEARELILQGERACVR